jgi:hypothetical protein
MTLFGIHLSATMANLLGVVVCAGVAVWSVRSGETGAGLIPIVKRIAEPRAFWVIVSAWSLLALFFTFCAVMSAFGVRSG